MSALVGTQPQYLLVQSTELSVSAAVEQGFSFLVLKGRMLLLVVIVNQQLIT